ncbi:MAG: DNA recombination protein RmuC [Planctomycetota bacterium]
MLDSAAVLGLIVLGVIVLAAAVYIVWQARQQTHLERFAAEAEGARAQADQEVARLRDELADLDRDRRELHDRVANAREELAGLRQTLEGAEQRRLDTIEQCDAKLRERDERDAAQQAEFRRQLDEKLAAIAGRALDASQAKLIEQATLVFESHREKTSAELERREQRVAQLVKPITETLARTDAKLKELEAARVTAFAQIAEQMKLLGEGSASLRDETSKLVTALRRPEVRGRYGEIQLEKVAEVAGMRAYCDFRTQAQTMSADGKPLRPDMVVRLPGGREIVVDAKANLAPYVDALDERDPDEQERHLERFAAGVREQAKKLGKKGYWASYDGSPDFVVMFVPGEQFIDAALRREPALIELASSENVILASPSTLIGLLRAVHVGWREKELSDNAEMLYTLGKELHERSATLLGHMDKLGDHLTRAVESYNKSVGSAQARLLPALRKFEDAGAKGVKELAEVKPVEALPSSTTSK